MADSRQDHLRRDSQRTNISRYSFEDEEETRSTPATSRSASTNIRPRVTPNLDFDTRRSRSSRERSEIELPPVPDVTPVSPVEPPRARRTWNNGSIPAVTEHITEQLISTRAPKPRIVLAIDYGTTFTGIAWMQTTGEDEKELSDIRTFKEWPEGTTPKVPSQYSYSKTTSEKKHKQWGHSIDDNSTVMQWTKLELEPRPTVKELEILRDLVKGLNLVNECRSDQKKEIPQHLTRDAGDIVRDYLSKISRTWWQHMSEDGQFTLKKVPLDIVVTHPASWKYEAMNKTYRAVMGAFPPGMFPTLRDVHFASEPESCALWVVQDLITKKKWTLSEGDCFVLCDAGGGTIDLVSYRVRCLEPLDLERVGGISGGKYGASFIDQAFLDYFQPKIENEILEKSINSAGHVVVLPLGRVLLRRFQRVKHKFDGTGTGDLTLPRGLQVLPEYEEELGRGVLTLTEQNLKDMFDKSIKGALDLIQRQIVQVQNTMDGDVPLQVTNIFLSGGFAESEYLFKKVESFGHELCIEVERADDCWSSVVRGAVLRGMGMGTVAPKKVEKCLRHYGFSLSESYAHHKHNNATTVVDPFHGRKVATNQLEWVVKKGSVILPDAPIVQKLSMGCNFTQRNIDTGASVRFIFVATAQNNPPTSLEQLPRDKNEIAYLDIHSSHIPKSALQEMPTADGTGYYYRCIVDAEFLVSHGVRVNLSCAGSTLRAYETSL